MNLRRASMPLDLIWSRVLVFGLGCLLLAAGTAEARVHRVQPGESIQAAIDAASTGDTILVWPGTYQEDPDNPYGLHITTSGLRLVGKVDRKAGEAGKVRLLANGTQQTGVLAEGAGPEDHLRGFYIRGFTVEGFPVNGIQTRFVTGFKMIRNESVNNLNNGIYPTLSVRGLVADNVSYGSLDTSLWVAGSENVRVVGNELYGSPIGFEITVSNNVWASFNDIHDNTIGVGLFHPNASANPPKPEMKNWVIRKNEIYDNNLPNPAPPGSFQAGVPTGGGVLLLGVSDNVIARNNIDGHDFFGVGVLEWCVAVDLGDPSRNCVNDPPVTPTDTANNLVIDNQVTGNAVNPPPPPLGPLAADIIYLVPGPPTGNCFLNNAASTISAPGGVLPTDGCF